MNEDKHVKIGFPLEPDEDGWPPVTLETLWAVELSDGLFRLDNIPFYACGVSDGDIVSAVVEDGRLTFAEVVHPSRNSTLRIIVFDPDMMQSTRDRFRALGCPSELSNIPSLTAIHIPGEIPFKLIAELLDEGEANGLWEHEEGVMRHQNPASASQPN